MAPTRGLSGRRRLRHSFRSAEGEYRPIPGRPNLSPAQRVVAQFAPEGLDRGLTPLAGAHALVNHGRWLVRCPWCTSAQYASREDPRFYCVDCQNAAVGGLWVPVVWPEEVQQIEELLSRRPNPQNRNWKPGESLADLERENLQHAAEILGGSWGG